MSDWAFEREEGTIGDIETAFDSNLAPKQRGRKKKKTEFKDEVLTDQKGENEIVIPAKETLSYWLHRHMATLTEAASSPIASSTVKVNKPPVGVQNNVEAAVPASVVAPPAPAAAKPKPVPEQRVHIKYPDESDADDERELRAFYYGVAGGVFLCVSGYFAYKLLFTGPGEVHVQQVAPPPPRAM